MLMAEPYAGVRGSGLGYDMARSTYITLMQAKSQSPSTRWDIYKEHL